MKTCTKCNESKSLDKFPFRKDRGNYRTVCKDCRNSGNARKYREANREKLASKAREYYAENSDRIKAVQKIYRESNPDVVKGCRIRRRARLADSIGQRTVQQTKARWEYHGNKCIYCGTDKNLSDEHLIPLARGGTDWPANIAPSCRSCNSKKHTRTHLEFITWLSHN